MPKYTNNDQYNLEQLLEEGWMDRLKTRGAEALGAAKGLGQRLGGVGKTISGAFSDDQDKISSGVEDIKRSKNVGRSAKIDYLKKNIEKRFKSFVNDLQNDLNKLGINIKIEMDSSISDSLESLKNSVGDAVDTPQGSNESPPPLPTSEPDDSGYDFGNIVTAQNAPKAPTPNIKEPLEKKPTTSPRFMSQAAKKRYEAEKAMKRKESAKKGLATKQQKKSLEAQDPRKGKIRKDPFAKYAAPEQEEDLDELFWK